MSNRHSRHASHTGIFDAALAPIPEYLGYANLGRSCQVVQEHHFPFQAGARAQPMWPLHLQSDRLVDRIGARLTARLVDFRNGPDLSRMTLDEREYRRISENRVGCMGLEINILWHVPRSSAVHEYQ